MPDYSKSFGEPMAPDETITSRLARKTSPLIGAAPVARGLFQHDSGYLRIHTDCRVPAIPDRRKIGKRSRRTAAVALGKLIKADACLLAAIEIRIIRDAQLLPGADIASQIGSGADGMETPSGPP